MKKKRIAIIGAGNHARHQHYPVLDYIEEIELCAVCDLDAAKRDEVRELYDIPSGYSDYKEMIEREHPDGVVIVTRPMELTDIALGCIELGAHVMIEKPPGCNSHESQQILDRAADENLKVMVSMNRRFMPLIRAIRDMALERGLVYCSATYNKHGFYDDKWDWPSPLAVADSIHLIDLMRFVGGEVNEVHAFTANRRSEFTNSCGGHIVYESGATGSVNTHHCVGTRVQRFEVHAHGMSAYLDVGNSHTPSCELWLDNEKVEPPQFPHEFPKGVCQDNVHETTHFARWITGETECESELSDVISSVRLAEALVAGYRGEMGGNGQPFFP